APTSNLGTYRVQYRLPEPAPKVSIIIPTRDSLQILRTCVESLRRAKAYPNVEIVVVDNQSRHPGTLWYFQHLKEQGVRILPYDAPFNYSAINNFAGRHSTGALLCFMNNDIEVISEDWLCEMASLALQPDVGAVGAKLYYPNETLQHGGVVLGTGGV